MLGQNGNRARQQRPPGWRGRLFARPQAGRQGLATTAWRVTAISGLIAAAVVVPVAVTSSGGGQGASGSQAANHLSAREAASPGTLPTVSESILTGLDDNCANGPTPANAPVSTLTATEGTQVCYQLTITPNAATLDGAKLDLSFVDSSGNASAAEQFRTGVLTVGSTVTKEVSAPLSVAGFTNGGSTTLDGSSPPVVTASTGIGTPTVTDVSSPAGAQSLTLALGDELTSASTPAYGGPYTVDVAGLLTGQVLTPAGTTKGSPVYLDASLSYTGGTAVVCGPTACAASASPTAPSITVTRSYSGASAGPYNVMVTVTNLTGAPTANDLTVCESANTGTATLADLTTIPACSAPKLLGKSVAGGSSTQIAYTYTPSATCGASKTNLCDNLEVGWQIPASLLATDSTGPTLTPSTSGSSSYSATPGVAAVTETVTPVPTGSDPTFDPVTGKWVAEGETVDYSITFTNNSSTDFSDVQVQDTLPAGLTLTSTLPKGATATGSEPTVITADLGTVAANTTSAAFTYTATVDNSIPTPDPIAPNTVNAGWTITPSDGPVVSVPVTGGVSYSPGVSLDVTQATPSVAVSVDTSKTNFDPSNCSTPDSSNGVPEGQEICYLVSVSPGTLASAQLELQFVDSTGNPGTATNDIQFRTKATTGTPSVAQASPLTTGTGLGNTTESIATDGSGPLTLKLGSITSRNPALDTVEVAAIAPGVTNPSAVWLQATLTALDTNGAPTGTPFFGETASSITPETPNVTVTKTVSSTGVTQPTIAQPGDTLSYQVTIANAASSPIAANDVGFCDDLSLSTSAVTISGFSSVITSPTGASTPGQTATGNDGLPVCAAAPPALDTAITLPPGFSEVIDYSVTFSATSAPTCDGKAATFPNYCNIAYATYQIPTTILPTDTTGPTLTPTMTGSSNLSVVGAPTITASMSDVTPNPPPSPSGSTYATIGQEFDVTVDVAVPAGGLSDASVVATLPDEMGVPTSATGALLGSTVSGTAGCTAASPCDAGTYATVTASDASATNNTITFNFGALTNSGNLGTTATLEVKLRSYVLNTTANQQFSTTSPPTGAPDVSMSYASPDNPSSSRTGNSVTLGTLTFVDEALGVTQTASNPVQDVNDHLTFTDKFTNTGLSPAYHAVLCTGITGSTIDTAGTGSPALVGSSPGSVAASGPDCSSQVEVSAGIVPASTTVTVVWSVVATATPPQSGLPVTGALSSCSLDFSTCSLVPPAVPAGIPAGTTLFEPWSPTGASNATAVGLTAPAISATSGIGNQSAIVLPDVQIGERLTYNVTFTVPVTGTDGTTFAIALNPGLAFATAGGNAVCTVGTTTSSSGCITASGLATSGTTTTGVIGPITNPASVTLGAPTGNGGSAPTLVVQLHSLRYPAGLPAGCPGSAQTGATNPCLATATVTLSYDVYVVDSSTAASTPLGTDGVAIPTPVSSAVAYKTVPDGAASTPLTTSAADLLIINPSVAAPTVTTSPPQTVQAEVGQTSPGPALVEFTATLQPPTSGTAFDATTTITLPAGLWVVNGADETCGTGAPVGCATVGSTGATTASGAPNCVPAAGATADACTTDEVTLGTAASQSTGVVTALVTPSKPVAPTTCVGNAAEGKPVDPATDGNTVVLQAGVLSQPVELVFFACVDSTTTAFDTAATSTAQTALLWYSVTPTTANPSLPLNAEQPGTPSPHLYPAAPVDTMIDFTGTSLSIMGTSNSAAMGGTATKTGYTIGNTVNYTATVTLPEVASALPSFDVCLFLPAGLTFNPTTSIGALTPGAGVSGVQTPTVVSSGTVGAIKTTSGQTADANCASQLSSLPSGTTLEDVQYPGGATVNYDAKYAGDTLSQVFTVIVGPDPSTLTRGNLETVEATAALAGRSGTLLPAAGASAASFYIVTPELSLGVTLSPSSKWTPGTPVVASVTITNNDADGFASPAYGDVVQLALPQADVGNAINPSMVSPNPSPPAGATWGSGAVQTSSTPNDTVTFSVTGGSILGSETYTMPVGFTLGNLLLDQTQVPVTASLIQAYSAANNAGRVYASPGSVTASSHTVAAVTKTIIITGPRSTVTSSITGPTGTVAPGSTPSWTISVANLGPSALTARNGVTVAITSTPALINPVITSNDPAAPYNQQSHLWGVALPVTSASSASTHTASQVKAAAASGAQLTLSGQVPDTATGTLTVSVQALPGPGVFDPNPKAGISSVSEGLQAQVSVSAGVKQGGNLYAGQPATYTLSAANAGPSPAGNIVLNDTLPPGTGFMSATGAGWACNKALPLNCSYAGPLVAGKTGAITLDVLIGSATGSTVSDTATVSTANNTSTQTTATVSGVVLAAVVTNAGANANVQSVTPAAASPLAVSSGGVAGSATQAAAAAAAAGAATSGSSSLAATGADVLHEFTLASLVLLVGAGLVSGARRRQRSASRRSRRSRRIAAGDTARGYGVSRATMASATPVAAPDPRLDPEADPVETVPPTDRQESSDGSDQEATPAADLLSAELPTAAPGDHRKQVRLGLSVVIASAVIYGLRRLRRRATSRSSR